MMQSTSLISKKSYLPPVVTVVKFSLCFTLLVTSNEGLDYEDLFAPQQNLFNEEPFQLMP